MVVRIVIAGETQCFKFAEVCLVADYLSQNLPDFHYKRIEKVVAEYNFGFKDKRAGPNGPWNLTLLALAMTMQELVSGKSHFQKQNWIASINVKHNWHHHGSPIVWKEMLIEGGKPFYIGGASEFLDYCFSYYKIDTYLWTEKFEYLLENFDQMKNKYKSSVLFSSSSEKNEEAADALETDSFSVCIIGAGHPLTMRLTSRLLEMSRSGKALLKLFLYDSTCDPVFLKDITRECSYIRTSHPGRCVRYVDKPGIALTQTDLLIVLDHEPFREEMSIGEWLHINKKKMEHLALTLNSSALKCLRVVFPNVGPACYNATILANNVNVINKYNIVVVTSDLGMDVSTSVAETAGVSVRNMYSPPVWGFVGINHLIDVNTTIHKYASFDSYKRYTKVKYSTLKIGTLKPEMRTMEYLLCFDNTLWSKVYEAKEKFKANPIYLNKLTAVVDLVHTWLFNPSKEHIVSLGILCDGSFGLKFKGVFSQPAKLVDGIWRPADDFFLPRDKNIKLNYLEYIARLMLELPRGQLKSVVPFNPCTCKPTNYKRKGVW